MMKCFNIIIVFSLILYNLNWVESGLFGGGGDKQDKKLKSDNVLKNSKETVESREETVETVETEESDGKTKKVSETKQTKSSKSGSSGSSDSSKSSESESESESESSSGSSESESSKKSSKKKKSGGGGGALGGLGGIGGGGGPTGVVKDSPAGGATSGATDVTNVDVLQITNVATLFEQFTTQYDKKYSKREKKSRLEIFTKTIDSIKSHNGNKKKPGYKMGINELSDLSFDEILSQKTGYKESEERDEDGDLILRESYPVPDVPNMPESWDWRKHGVMTPARNQGKCGSCWSYAAACCLESHNMKRLIAEGKFDKTKQVFVSEQNLIDCSAEKFGSQGCEGGMPQQAWRYVAANGGVNTLDSYPYTGKKDECAYKKENDADAVVADAKRLKTGIDADLAKAIYNYGPVAIAVHVTRDMAMYKTGIFDDPTCSAKKVNHAVVAVGYGPNYFIIRNSWGDRWGEEGYIKIARTKVGNNCGVSQQGYFPVLPNAVDTEKIRDKFKE